MITGQEGFKMAMERHEHSTELIAQFMSENGLRAMELVRLCGVSVTSAYRIANGRSVTDLNVIYKVFVGLREAGYTVTWVGLTGIE